MNWRNNSDIKYIILAYKKCTKMLHRDMFYFMYKYFHYKTSSLLYLAHYKI